MTFWWFSLWLELFRTNTAPDGFRPPKRDRASEEAQGIPVRRCPHDGHLSAMSPAMREAPLGGPPYTASGREIKP